MGGDNTPKEIRPRFTPSLLKKTHGIKKIWNVLDFFFYVSHFLQVIFRDDFLFLSKKGDEKRWNTKALHTLGIS